MQGGAALSGVALHLAGRCGVLRGRIQARNPAFPVGCADHMAATRLADWPSSSEALVGGLQPAAIVLSEWRQDSAPASWRVLGVATRSLIWGQVLQACMAVTPSAVPRPSDCQIDSAVVDAETRRDPFQCVGAA